MKASLSLLLFWQQLKSAPNSSPRLYGPKNGRVHGQPWMMHSTHAQIYSMACYSRVDTRNWRYAGVLHVHPLMIYITRTLANPYPLTEVKFGLRSILAPLSFLFRFLQPVNLTAVNTTVTIPDVYYKSIHDNNIIVIINYK